MKKNAVIFAALTLCVHLSAQETVLLPVSRPAVNPPEEVVMRDDSGRTTTFASVSQPSITVRLADPDKASGAAVMLFAGGGLMSHSWGSDFEDMADWLNARGIAAVGVKYRTRIIDRSAPRAAAPAAPREKPQVKALQNMNLEITDFGMIRNANTSPSTPDAEDTLYDDVAEDCVNAMRTVVSKSSEWGLDPARIGWMGFSAGGGVELAGLMKAPRELYPAFIVTCFGPSFVDITVPENAPELFIAVHADHPNVAAGCLALFLAWKNAGAEAEMHIYEKNTGNIFGSAGSGASSETGGDWKDLFYSWACSNGFFTR